MDLRAYDEKGGFAKLMIFHKETKLATELGMRLRLTSGNVSGPLEWEAKAGVPYALAGRSLYPKNKRINNNTK